MFIFRRCFCTFLHLPENSKIIQNACRIFAEKQLKPVASEHDKLAKFPQKQIEQLAREGFMGACIDPKYGCKGLNLLTFTLVIEELSRCCASAGIIVSIHNCLYASLVQSYGTQEQIQEFLVPFTSGKIGVFALSEPDVKHDHDHIRTHPIILCDYPEST